MYWYRYRRKRTGPKKVKNGIKVRAKRGELGQSWLAKEWMESLQMATWADNEFTRGRTYARKGQVLSVEVGKGSVIAMVQGSAPRPYKVNITIDMPDSKFRKSFAEMLKEKPAYAAAILAGELPKGVADEMSSRGFDFFPVSRELKTACGCDSWADMCKHGAAACYILAEEFDRDPLLYLKIRGIDRTEFVEMVQTGKQKEARTPPPPTTDGRISMSGGLVPGFCVSGMPAVYDGEADIPSDPREFWGYKGRGADSYDSALAPAEPAALPKTLGRFPMWRGEGQFLDLLEEIYGTASRTGANAYLGIRGTGGAAGLKGQK